MKAFSKLPAPTAALIQKTFRVTSEEADRISVELCKNHFSLMGVGKAIDKGNLIKFGYTETLAVDATYAFVNFGGFYTETLIFDFKNEKWAIGRPADLNPLFRMQPGENNEAIKGFILEGCEGRTSFKCFGELSNHCFKPQTSIGSFGYDDLTKTLALVSRGYAGHLGSHSLLASYE